MLTPMSPEANVFHAAPRRIFLLHSKYQKVIYVVILLKFNYDMNEIRGSQ